MKGGLSEMTESLKTGTSTTVAQDSNGSGHSTSDTTTPTPSQEPQVLPHGLTTSPPGHQSQASSNTTSQVPPAQPPVASGSGSSRPPRRPCLSPRSSGVSMVAKARALYNSQYSLKRKAPDTTGEEEEEEDESEDEGYNDPRTRYDRRIAQRHQREYDSEAASMPGALPGLSSRPRNEIGSDIPYTADPYNTLPPIQREPINRGVHYGIQLPSLLSYLPQLLPHIPAHGGQLLPIRSAGNNPSSGFRPNLPAHGGQLPPIRPAGNNPSPGLRARDGQPEKKKIRRTAAVPRVDTPASTNETRSDSVSNTGPTNLPSNASRFNFSTINLTLPPAVRGTDMPLSENPIYAAQPRTVPARTKEEINAWRDECARRYDKEKGNSLRRDKAGNVRQPAKYDRYPNLSLLPTTKEELDYIRPGHAHYPRMDAFNGGKGNKNIRLADSERRALCRLRGQHEKGYNLSEEKIRLNDEQWFETQLLRALGRMVGPSLNRWTIISGLTPIRMVNGRAVVDTTQAEGPITRPTLPAQPPTIGSQQPSLPPQSPQEAPSTPQPSSPQPSPESSPSPRR